MIKFLLFDPDGARIFTGKATVSVFVRNKAIPHRKRQAVSLEMLRSACRKRLGFAPRTILPVAGGKGSCVYGVESEDGRRFAIKIGIFADHHSPCHELLFTTIVTRHTRHIPVQDICVADVSGELMPWPYSISRWLPGVSIKDLVSGKNMDGSEPVFGHLGRIAGQIHSISLQTAGFGNVTGDCIRDFILTREIPVPLHGEDDTAEVRYVRPACEAASFLSQNFILERNDYDYILTLLADEMPEPGGIVFQHGDMSMGNFLTDKNVITGVLDGSGMIGFRLEELAGVFMFLQALEFYFPGFSAQRAFDGFVSGYSNFYEEEVSEKSFRFFLITNVLKHMVVLMKSGRQKHISDYVKFLRKYLERP